MKRIGVLVLLSLLAACASPTMWYRDGATQAEFDRDKNACLYEAEKAVAGNPSPLQQGWLMSSLYRQCMYGKGYTDRRPT